LLSSLLIGPATAIYVENRRGRLSEILVAAAPAKAQLQSLLDGEVKSKQPVKAYFEDHYVRYAA